MKTLVMSELGHALKHCYENGIVHGDLQQQLQRPAARRLDGKIDLVDVDFSCVFVFSDSDDETNPEGSDHVDS